MGNYVIIYPFSVAALPHLMMWRVVADGVVDLGQDLLRRVVLQRRRRRGHRQRPELLDEAAVLVHDAPHLGG